jgi:hypothetical protein
VEPWNVKLKAYLHATVMEYIFAAAMSVLFTLVIEVAVAVSVLTNQNVHHFVDSYVV